MKNWLENGRIRGTLTLALALLVGFPAATVPQEGSLAPLQIRVKDVYGRVLAGAKVHITNNWTSSTTEAVTDAEGRALVWVTPGSLRIAVSLTGYGGLTAANFCVPDEGPTRFVAALGPDQSVPAGPPVSAPTILTAPPSVPSVVPMNGAEIREAMEFGRKSPRLKGYRLTASRWLARSDVGELFTPFLRVAAMTQVAAATERHLAEGEVPRAVLEQVVWIVAAPGQYIEDDEYQRQRYDVPPVEVTVEPNGDRDPRKAIRPVWKARVNSACDSRVFERILGRRFPWPGIVAAFPTDVLKEGHVIAVSFSKTATQPGSWSAVTIAPETKRVRIRVKDLHAWK